MAASSFPAEARAVQSCHDELWQVSWGETDIIAALKEEMSHAVGDWQNKQQAQFQAPAQEVNTAKNCCLPGFQPTGFIMTVFPGTKCQVPAMVFSAQPEQPALSVIPTSARPRPRPSNSMCIHDAERPVRQQGMTLADFGGELPSVGSEGHFDGTCKRCAFFPKGRCTNGKDCGHCHFTHELRPRLRKRNATKGNKDTCQHEACMADDTCHTDRLSHARLDLTEPPAESSTAVVSSQPQDIMVKFNSALEDLAQAYNVDSDHKDKDADGSTLDSLTTCALSDREDMSSVSDSETSSVQAGLPQVEEEEPASPPGVSTSTSWLSMQRSRRAGKSTTMDVGRMARALLNKLTEQHFEPLCVQILALPVSTPEQLAVVVAEIFQKATTQDGFRNLYTELCMRMDAHFGQMSSAIGGKTFRNALVNECQATFERNLLPADASVFVGLNTDESFEVEMMMKTRRLGNMRFIGDLLVRRLLAPKLLLSIVQQLLNHNEAALESLIALLTVVGPEFEMKQSMYQAPLRDAFAVLRGKMVGKAVCARVGCQINDLLDAKARCWALRPPSC